MSNIVTTKMFGQQLNLGHWSTDGLVFYWRGIPAGNAVDDSLYRNHGTLVGPVWDGGGLKFVGTEFSAGSDYIDIPDSPSLDITQQITLMAFIRTGTVPSSVQGVIQKYAVTDTNRCYLLFINSSKRLAFSLRGAAAEFGTPNTGPVLAPNTNYFIAGTYDGVTMRTYINGIANNTLSQVLTINTTNFPAGLGRLRHNDTILGFTGHIFCAVIYDRALSASEIADFNINPDLPMQQGTPVWLGQAPAAGAGLAGIYYRTLLQGVS